MDTDTFLQAIDEMMPEERAQHFEALMSLALSIEEKTRQHPSTMTRNDDQ